MKKQLFSLALAASLVISATSFASPLHIAKQGMFSAGGVTITSPGTFDPYNQWEATGKGQTAHVDHANVLYQIPQKADKAPIIFLHGYGQSRMGWMTTPDGREGWSDMFLKNGHGVFLVDEPRRGEAGATSVSGDISTKTLEQRWYTQFRIGKWENGKSVPNTGSQFANSDEAVDQFFRQMTPDTGMKSDMGADFDGEMVAKALAATVEKVYSMTGKKLSSSPIPKADVLAGSQLNILKTLLLSSLSNQATLLRKAPLNIKPWQNRKFLLRSTLAIISITVTPNLPQQKFGKANCRNVKRSPQATIMQVVKV